MMVTRTWSAAKRPSRFWWLKRSAQTGHIHLPAIYQKAIQIQGLVGNIDCTRRGSPDANGRYDGYFATYYDGIRTLRSNGSQYLLHGT